MRLLILLAACMFTVACEPSEDAPVAAQPDAEPAPQPDAEPAPQPDAEPVLQPDAEPAPQPEPEGRTCSPADPVALDLEFDWQYVGRFEEEMPIRFGFTAPETGRFAISVESALVAIDMPCETGTYMMPAEHEVDLEAGEQITLSAAPISPEMRQFMVRARQIRPAVDPTECAEMIALDALPDWRYAGALAESECDYGCSFHDRDLLTFRAPQAGTYRLEGGIDDLDAIAGLSYSTRLGCVPDFSPDDPGGMSAGSIIELGAGEMVTIFAFASAGIDDFDPDRAHGYSFSVRLE